VVRPPAEPPRFTPPPGSRIGASSKQPTPKRRRGGLPRWLPAALILLLIGGGVTLIVIGFFTDAGEQNTANEATQPATNPSPQAKGQKQKAPSGQAQATQPATTPATPPTSAAGIDRRTFAGRYELGVPSGWRSGERDQGTLLTAPGGQAEVQVFFGQQSGSLDAFAAQASDLLRQRHDGAQVGRPQATTVGGQRALRVNATYRGGSAAAIVLSQGSFTYLLMDRIDAGTPAAISGQAQAVLQSFRAL
jgi:hypothetical protein